MLSFNDKMKFTFWFLLNAFSISFTSCADSNAHIAAKKLTNVVDKCPKDNSFPVCGTNGLENLLFGNECLLKEAGRKRGVGDFTKTTLKTCFMDCDLICLGYYDPMCAIDPITNRTRTFDNKCEAVKDACSKEIDWQLYRQGRCLKRVKKLKRSQVEIKPKQAFKRKRKPIPCPKIFNPVCAVFTGVKSTFINECLVNAENVETGKDWRIFSQGICEEDYTSVSKPHSRHAAITKRSLNLSEFDNFKNVFELGEPVTFIRTPPIFHTEFIKGGESEEVFKGKEMTMHAPLEDQEKGKTQHSSKTEDIFLQQLLTNGHAGINMPAPHMPKSEEGRFKAMISGLNYNVPPQHFYPPPNNIRTQLALKHFNFGAMPLEREHFNVEACKLGSTQLCCSFQHKTRTFKNVCELNLHNELTGEDWQLEHEGDCRDCNFMCSKLFKPLCVSMNGLLYTLRNECILNAAMCKYGEREWRVIKNGVCDAEEDKEYRQVIDKYATMAPGFRYTSKYDKPEETTTTTTEVATTTSTPRNFPAETTLKSNEKSAVQPLNQTEHVAILASTTVSSIITKPSIETKAATPKYVLKSLQQKATNDFVFVVEPVKPPAKVKKSTTSLKPNANVKKNKDATKSLLEPVNLSTTPPNSIQNTEIESKDQDSGTNIQNLLGGSKMVLKIFPFKQNSLKESLKSTPAATNRLSMYRPHGNSVMSTLLEALDESSKSAADRMEKLVLP